VPASLVTARTVSRVLAGRLVAGPGAVDAVRVAAELVPGGFRMALEHEPGPGEDAVRAFGELIDRVGAAGIAPACQLTLPVGRLGTESARMLADAAGEAGLGVALAGSHGAVESVAAGRPDAVVVVPAGRADAESVCRARSGARVRLTAGRGAAADLAFVRCLNVLMAGTGSPAVAAGDRRLIAITGERAAWNDRSPESWEYVMPYGVGTEQQRRLVASGSAVRVALPSGAGAALAVMRRLAGRS
jgi:proline dehydrogenase